MAPYEPTLSKCFPYRITVLERNAQAVARMLITSRKSASIGSSFAVTSDAPHGYRNIWLSAASYKTLFEEHIVPELYQISSTQRGE